MIPLFRVLIFWIVIPALTLLLIFVVMVYWHKWSIQRQYEDIIEISCEYKFIECANQSTYFIAKEVNNKHYDFIINEPLELKYSHEYTNVDSLFSRSGIDYTSTEFIAVGKLYKERSANEYYDCNVGAYRLEILAIKTIQ